MNILITSAGRRVSLVRAFQQELKAIFPESKVLAADAAPELSAACHVADANFQVPYITDPNYFNTLIQHCKANDVRLIIPTIDTELKLLAEEVATFERQGIQVVISSRDFVNKCRDKRVIHEFFKASGIKVAEEYPKDDHPLPIFIKPYDGSRSVDTFLITDKSQLKPYHYENEKLMFLEYLDHNEFDEYTCDLYYGRDHELKCIVPRKRVEVRDGEVNKGLTEKGDLIEYIKNHLSRIDGAVGCLTTQFFKHKTKPLYYGIEVNPRFGGGYPLSYLAGANYPKWIIQEFLQNKSIEGYYDDWEDQLLMLRYDDEILVHGYSG